MSTLTSIISGVYKSIFKILHIKQFLNFSKLSQLLQLGLVEANTLAKIKLKLKCGEGHPVSFITIILYIMHYWLKGFNLIFREIECVTFRADKNRGEQASSYFWYLLYSFSGNCRKESVFITLIPNRQSPPTTISPTNHAEGP